MGVQCVASMELELGDGFCSSKWLTRSVMGFACAFDPLAVPLAGRGLLRFRGEKGPEFLKTLNGNNRKIITLR